MVAYIIKSDNIGQELECFQFIQKTQNWVAGHWLEPKVMTTAVRVGNHHWDAIKLDAVLSFSSVICSVYQKINGEGTCSWIWKFQSAKGCLIQQRKTSEERVVEGCPHQNLSAVRYKLRSVRVINSWSKFPEKEADCPSEEGWSHF